MRAANPPIEFNGFDEFLPREEARSCFSGKKLIADKEVLAELYGISIMLNTAKPKSSGSRISIDRT